ncbi:MAG: ABC transporter permease [Gammaproteobacteria bacterium]
MYLKYYIGFRTLVIKEVRRFLSFWLDTMLPPIITTALYYLIFGHFIGQRVGMMGGFSYMQFIAPGLIMMSVITGSYTNVAFSFFTTKFFRSIEDLLVSPLPSWLIVAGYMAGGVVRGCILFVTLTVTSLFFTKMPFNHPFYVGFAVIFISMTFSLAGFINAIFAKRFDDIGVVPTFVLTPLIYLGGVFFSVQLLSTFWLSLSKLNPILYFISLFRYGMLGVSDVSVPAACILLGMTSLVLFLLAWILLDKGVGVKT